MKEIAREAGVSPTVVSKVLHGGNETVRVSAKTAEHVREVALRLNYVPNGLARSLRRRRADTIGLVFENFGHITDGPLFYSYLLDGVAEELFSHHFRLAILPEIDPDNPLATLADGRLDGVIWCKMPSTQALLHKLRGCPIPIVALNAPSALGSDDTLFIACDNEAGTELGVRHLVELGHRRILFVSERGEVETPDAVARLNGFCRACRTLGVTCNENDQVVWNSRAQEFDGWWNSNSGHTAVFAWNEGMGAAVLREAAKAGVKVPQQLSVIGFDSTQFCETTTPKLTAVRQPIREMATQAAKAVVAMLEGHESDRDHVLFPCELDVRRSTGPVP